MSSFLAPLRLIRQSSTDRAESVRLRLYLMIMAIDLLLMVATLMVIGASYRGPDSFDGTMRIVMLTVMVFIPMTLVMRGVSAEVLRNPVMSMRRGAMTVMQTALIITAIAFSMKIGSDLSRLVLILGFCIGLGLVMVHRVLMGSTYYHLYGGDAARVLLIDDHAPAGALGNLEGHRVKLDSRTVSFDDPYVMDQLAATTRLFDRVIVACCPDRRAEWSFMLKGSSINGEIVDETVDRLGAMGVSMDNGVGRLRVAVPSMGLRNRALKRATDLAIAVSAIIALAPLMLVVALLIKLEDGGPVLFRQTRIGRNNALFQILKFRSMRVAASDASASKLTTRNDGRVTRVGNFIRRTSIDELPQLFNVLSGTMSIVGPRPHATGARAGDALYWEVDRGYWHRHRLKPGLTGLAQVRGHRGPTDTEDDLQQRLYSDLEYIRNWSFFGDIGILLKTVRVVTHSNAF